ncbi:MULTISPECIES: hypothetical protein [unclassified Acinetobacter]|uniref:hypothetical protein n=1 Tax=unclassified Acinetobacter TaxID=196816 RepID=UPI0035BB19BD
MEDFIRILIHPLRLIFGFIFDCLLESFIHRGFKEHPLLLIILTAVVFTLIWYFVFLK